MSFALYLGGLVLVLLGVGYAATLMHMPIEWIAVVIVIFGGLGILSAVAHTRTRDKAQ